MNIFADHQITFQNYVPFWKVLRPGRKSVPGGEGGQGLNPADH